MPIKLNYVQGTPEWHEMRLRHLGASEVAIVLRESPYMDPYALFLLKTGQKEPAKQSKYTRHGIDMEAEARDAFTEETGLFVAPVCFECDAPGYEFLECSLDGFDGRGGERFGVEIKAPREPDDHRSALEGRVPAAYWIQCQAQIYVAQLDYQLYWSYYRPDAKKEPSSVLLRVEPDTSFIENELKPQAKEFWDWVERGEYPMPSGKVEREDAEWRALAEEAAMVLGMREEVDERMRRLRAKLSRLTHANKVTSGCGIEVEWSHTGAAMMPAYRRAPFLSMTIRRLV